VIILGALALAVDRLVVSVGYCVHDQEVVIESPRKIQRLKYSLATLDDETRQRALPPFGKEYFEWRDDAFRNSENRFTVTIPYTCRESLFRTWDTYPFRHLAILIEFTDGGSARHIADLPLGTWEPIVVRFP
jgi:hypothetical protein